MQETPYTFDSADALRDPKSCKPNRGTADSPLFQFNHWVEKVPRSPDLGAEVNAYDFLVERARECRLVAACSQTWSRSTSTTRATSSRPRGS